MSNYQSQKPIPIHIEGIKNKEKILVLITLTREDILEINLEDVLKNKNKKTVKENKKQL